MTLEELLKPRFEIIADYPNCQYNVGRILTPVNGRHKYYECLDAPASDLIRNPQDYPHLFRKLPWWELRRESEMPMYLKSLATGGVEKILKWDMDKLFGMTEEPLQYRIVGCDLLAWAIEYGYVPIDEEEYLSSAT